jgi:hypothetical protein
MIASTPQLPTGYIQLPPRRPLRQGVAPKSGPGGWKFVAAVAVLFAAFCPATAFAQDDAFRRGLDAREKKNWKTVVTEMRAAIDSDPKEAPRKVGGGIFRGGMEYLPHFFLGEALFYLEDCAGAVTEWAASEQQAGIRTRREFLTFIASGYRTCATRGVLAPPEFNAQSAAAIQDVKEAVAYAERVSKLGNADAWRPDLREQYSRIAPDLSAAQTKLAVAMRSRSAADFADGRAAAGRVVAALKVFEASLNASIENLSSVGRQARQVEQVISGAENNDRAIDALNTKIPQALAASRQNLRDVLARARDQARTGERTQSAAAVGEALKSAQEAATLFDQLLVELTTIAHGALERDLADAVAAAREALSFLDSSMTTLGTLFRDKPAMVTPEVQSRRDALDTRVSAIRRRVEAAEKTQNAGALRAAARLAADARTDLETLVTSFGPLSLRFRGVQGALEDGARQFFAGEYQQALATLDSNGLADAPLQLHVHLFRAAALYHLYVRSGEKEQTLRTRALAEIDACKRLNSQFAPDSRAFAPRFLAFYQNNPATP